MMMMMATRPRSIWDGRNNSIYIFYAYLSFANRSKLHIYLLCLALAISHVDAFFKICKRSTTSTLLSH